MRKRLEVGVIGLGKFGLQLGVTLMELGHRVVGVDKDEQRVRHVQEMLSQVYQGDATDRNVVDQLRFQDLDAVAVSVGRSMEDSILITLNLQELKAANIIAKAVSAEHRKVLQRLGAHRVIQPEADVAVQTAHRLSVPGMLDLLPVGGGVLIQEVTIDVWAGKNLIDLNLGKKGVLAAGVKKRGSAEYQFVPDPTAFFEAGDSVILFGEKEALLALAP